eukprot:8915681-Prorocentrum_lima.AAC.1
MAQSQLMLFRRAMGVKRASRIYPHLENGGRTVHEGTVFGQEGEHPPGQSIPKAKGEKHKSRTIQGEGGPIF